MLFILDKIVYGEFGIRLRDGIEFLCLARFLCCFWVAPLLYFGVGYKTNIGICIFTYIRFFGMYVMYDRNVAQFDLEMSISMDLIPSPHMHLAIEH